MEMNGLDRNNNFPHENEEDDFISCSQASVESVHFTSDDDGVDDLDCKIFNDPIHGHILLHPLLVLFIDTPQFQRLRNIKQLGSTYFVYPGASHNRFEHCIGTAYLAGKLARFLKTNQKNLQITDKDVLCVELAGLCHDLGHGPFSHMFDLEFLPLARPGCKWTHEKGSCMMLDYLIEDNDMWPQMEKYGLSPIDVIFIKEMIAGPLTKHEKAETDKKWLYTGRREEMSFLYEIVSNERNKVDVDKWDYFARDCHHLGISNCFDHNRFMQFIRVLKVEGERLQICARDKESINLYEMFHTRSILHKKAYQHRVSKAIDTMICEAMVLADPFFQIIGKNGKKYRISESIDDPAAYMKLTDNVLSRISDSTDEKLRPAREILNKIYRRKIYKNIGTTRPGQEYLGDFKKISHELVQCDPTNTLRQADLIVGVVKVNYGMMDKNPIDSFKFFSKSNPRKPYHIRKEDVSGMLPDVFQDQEVIVYCKQEEKVAAAQDCFKTWCKNNSFRPKENGMDTDQGLTPMKRPNAKKGKLIESKKMKIEF